MYCNPENVSYRAFPEINYNQDSMDIAELTNAMHRFVRAQGWYEPDSLRPQSLRNLAISLNLEAGEVLEHFQWNDQFEDTAGLAEELADVALYLLQIASIAGIDLEDAIIKKLERNYHRTWDQEINDPRQPPPDQGADR
jgi:NTP pyrophosphatase (non-canonical NTP hydrolase)